MKLTLILALGFLICSTTFAKQLDYQSCPKRDYGSYLTKNNYGNSTYKGNGVEDVMKYLVQIQKLDLSKPILDVGAGYGAASYELIKFGATNLYINELSKDNLRCLKQNLDKNFKNNNLNLHYLLGDISKSKVLNAIPTHSLSMIYAQNVIHFFTAQQIFSFFENSANLLENNGLLFISFENPYLDQQNRFVDNIYNIYSAKNTDDTISLESVVLEQYKTKDITNGIHCSAQNYENTSNSIKTPGFPCLLERVINEEYHPYQLLIPEMVSYILERKGFKVVETKKYNDKNGTFIIIARRVFT